jgi:hypothetical protein
LTYVTRPVSSFRPFFGDITKEAVEAFLVPIRSGNVENATEWAAQSTMIALLGRAAILSGREVTWKREFDS